MGDKFIFLLFVGELDMKADGTPDRICGAVRGRFF